MQPVLHRALALAVCALFAAGCAASSAPDQAPASSGQTTLQTPAGEGGSDGTLCVGYTESDGFNPYRVNSSLVAQNAGLVFEKLVEINPEMELEYRLAQSILCSGTQVILTPRGGCTFADGTPITAEDILASLQAAQASAMYGGRFANVTGMRVQDGLVVLDLAVPDSLFAYLCDIPVMKAGETALAAPTASGRYTYGAGADLLVANPRAPFGAGEGPAEIRLWPVSGYDELVSSFAQGSVNLYDAISDSDATGSMTSQQSFYRTNELIYLGVNSTSDKPLLAAATGRTVLSRLTDRRALAQESFYSRAYPATGIINSFYPCVRDAQAISADPQTEDLPSLLGALGYTLDTTAGHYTDAAGARLEVQLLVYTGSVYKRYAANLLREQWGEAGIYLQIVEQDNFDQYKEQVLSGQFELYIGEVKLYNNMDITPFLPGGSLSAGLAQNEELPAARDAFRLDAAAAGALEQAFADLMPLVPLVWQNGTVVCNRDVTGVSASVSGVFYSLANLSVAQADESS